jgi:hypothetical protein
MAAPPTEIAIERRLCSRLEAITKMTFKAADRLLCLGLWFGSGVMRGIGGIEPYSAIAIKSPVSPALRVAKLGLKSPAINSPVDEPRRAVFVLSEPQS